MATKSELQHQVDKQINTDKELAILKNEVSNIKEQNTKEHSQIICELNEIKSELTRALAVKADRVELMALEKEHTAINQSIGQIWKILIGVGLAMASMILGLLGWLIQKG